MQLCTCFLLLNIFALTNSLSQIKPKEKGRRFNPALETVTIHSNEDTKNLNNRQDITANATDIAPEVKTFTDFFLETVNILNTYEDTAFQEFFHILDIEIMKYHYGGCKFSELMQNHNTRRLVVGILKMIREHPIIFTKADINLLADMLRVEVYDQNVKELLDYINNLYRNKEPEFQRVLNNLKRYTKTKSIDTSRQDLKHVIRDGIRTILFNHYTELDTYTRRELKENIETFWGRFKKGPNSNADKNHIPKTDSVSRSVLNNIKISNMKNKEKVPDFLKNDPQTNFLDQKKKIVSIESYDEKSQEIENDENSVQSGTLASDNIAEEISSGQSFASSTNSTKKSQDRSIDYNTQRYTTLYTEEIPYRARTTNKTEIIPISEKVTTRRPTIPRQLTTTPRYSRRDVSSDKKKKVKKLRINQDTYDPFDNSFFTSHETENLTPGLTLKLKREPGARVHYEKRRHAVDTPVDLDNPNDVVNSVKSVSNVLLKSLAKLAETSIFGMDAESDTNFFQNFAGGKLEPTKNKLPASLIRAQNEIKPQKPNVVTKSPSRYRTQPNEPRRNIEPHLNSKEVLLEKVLNKQKSVRQHDNTKVKHFNEFINSKIKKIENELTEIKQVNELVTKLTKNKPDEVDVRNVTDNDGIIDKDKIKQFKEYAIELLNRYRKINHGEINDTYSYTTKNTKTPSKAKVVKNRAVDIVNDDTSQTTDHNVNITTDTEELNKAVSTENVTTTSVAYDRIIRHKNPFDHIDMKFLSRTL